jgi:hypothetical protein
MRQARNPQNIFAGTVHDFDLDPVLKLRLSLCRLTGGPCGFVEGIVRVSSFIVLDRHPA